jgi:hypothetical protein
MHNKVPNDTLECCPSASVFWVLVYSFLLHCVVICSFRCTILYILFLYNETKQKLGNNGPYMLRHSIALLWIVWSVMQQFLGRLVNGLLPGGPATVRDARAWVPLDLFSARTCGFLRCFHSLHVAVVALIYTTSGHCCCCFSIYTIISLWLLFLCQHRSLEHQIMIDNHGTDTTCFRAIST